MRFDYYLPVNLIFGRGCAEKIGTEVSKYGKKVLIVTGRNSAKKSGLLDRSIDLLKAEGVNYTLFDKVQQNPLTTTAEEGANVARTEGCDVILALGGGSIIDAAKGIAFLVKNRGDVNDYILNKQIGTEALPVIVVPTTCGTGSEGNRFAVLTNPETGDKKSLRCDAIYPKSSIIDPELMTTMPKGVLASVGFDSLCHNMESYLSNKGQPMTDMMALQGIELSGKHLVNVYENPDDMEGWESISWASTLGGMTINIAGLTMPHGMEHPASGLKDIVHGKGLAALTPVIYEGEISYAPEKFAQISKRLGGRDENDCVEVIRKLLERLKLNTTLSEQGIKKEDIPWMVENCQKVGIANISNAPRKYTAEDIERIYRKAL